MLKTEDKILLTQFARGAGCGCKIAPQVLKEILQSNALHPRYTHLLVGNASNDDAAVYDFGNGKALIATADFFTPVVDDAYDFGRVAAANAISDVYAMGGTPVMALALLGWPVDKLPAKLAQQVIEGGRFVCAEAGIPLAGGHSIDTPEPLFGLSVNGFIETPHLKRNDTAKEGDLIFLTKALGTGILSAAQKRGLLRDEDRLLLLRQLTQLNKIGEHLGKVREVTAMTDVTGFGLLGHLIEMASGSGLTALVDYSALPKIKSLPHYMALGIVPDATYRNWNAYESQAGFAEDVNISEAFSVLPDPQTNGGILFSVRESASKEVIALLVDQGLQDFARPVGRMLPREEKYVRVKN